MTSFKWRNWILIECHWTKTYSAGNNMSIERWDSKARRIIASQLVTRIESPFQASLHSCSLFPIALLSFHCDSPFRVQSANLVDTSYDSPRFQSKFKKSLNRETCTVQTFRRFSGKYIEIVTVFASTFTNSEYLRRYTSTYLHSSSAAPFRRKAEEASSVLKDHSLFQQFVCFSWET